MARQWVLVIAARPETEDGRGGCGSSWWGRERGSGWQAEGKERKRSLQGYGEWEKETEWGEGVVNKVWST